MPSARGQNHGRTRVEPSLDRVHLDGGVVDVGDPTNPPGHRLAQVVVLSLANPAGVELSGIRRIQRNDNSALDDGLRGVGLRVGGSWAGNAQGGWHINGLRHQGRGTPGADANQNAAEAPQEVGKWHALSN